MTRTKLIITDDERFFRLTWFFPDEEDVGGNVGDGPVVTAANLNQLAKKNREDWEADAASFCAQQTDGVCRDDRGLFWETRSQAAAALRACKKAIADGPPEGHPWPEWATKAASEGWKPPKGWKP